MEYIRRIRNLREDNDYTQEYVASQLGTSQTMYARYERGANELPIIVLQAALAIFTLDEKQQKAADVDGKEGVTLEDAKLVLEAALEIRKL